MFFSLGCFVVPQTQQINFACQIQLHFIPSPVAGIRGQTFIRRAIELPNCIPKPTEQKSPFVTLFLREKPKHPVFFFGSCTGTSAVVRPTRVSPAEQQLWKSKICSGPFLNNALDAVSSDGNSAIHTNKSFPDLQLPAAKALLSLLVSFAPG